MPLIPAGTSGTPASSAIRAAPVCACASYVLRRPFLRRVPSGNIAITWPSRASGTAVSIASRSACPRRTLKPPHARDERPEREPEELRLGHEAQEAPRPEREPERPRVEDSRRGRRRGRSRRLRADSPAPYGPVPERRGAGSARKRRRSGSRAERAWADGSPAASIADPGASAKVAREMAAPKTKKLVIVESPAKAKTIAGYLGNDFVVESSIGHIRDLPQQRLRDPGEVQGREAGRASASNVENDFEPLYVVDARQEEGRLRAEGEAQGRRRAAARDGRGSRGRGDRLASRRRSSSRRCRCAGWSSTRSRGRRSSTRSTETRDIDDSLVDAQEARRDPRPAVRLRGLAGALAEGDAGPVRRARAVRRDAARRRARARADERSSPPTTGTSSRPSTRARSPRASPRVDGQRVAQGRDFGRDGELRTNDAVQLVEDDARGLAAALDGAEFRVASVEEKPYTPPPGAAVHDLDAAAGGEPQAAPLVAADDARRAAALRERLHHLHAHRLDDAVGVGAHRGARPGARALRGRLRAGRSRAGTSAR